VTARLDTDQTARGGTAVSSPFLLFWRTAGAELAGCWPVFALAALYLACTVLLALFLPGDQAVAPFTYVGLWLGAALPFGFLFLVWRTLPAVLRERPESPLLALGARLKGYLTPAAILGAALIATQALTIGIFTSAKNMLPDISGYVWDQPFADIDAASQTVVAFPVFSAGASNGLGRI